MNNLYRPHPFLLEVVGIAFTYWGLYYLNQWVFSSFEFTSRITWIFLPAAIRMVAVLLFSWRGVTGLFIGTTAINLAIFGYDKADTYDLALLSAVCPMFAMLAGGYLMKVKADLSGLRAWQLLVFALLGALFTSTANNLYFQYSGMAASWQTGLLPMFVGDLVGTLIVLYAAAAILRSLSSTNANQR